MARHGITAQQVAAAADAIKGRGLTPTIGAIRAELGTGSFTTIAQFLAKWKTEGVAQADDETPPPEAVENAALAAINQIWKIALASANEDSRTIKAAHEEELQKLNSDLTEAHTEITELEKMNQRMDNDVEKAEKAATDSANEVMRLTGEVQALHRAILILKQPIATGRKATDTKPVQTKAPKA